MSRGNSRDSRASYEVAKLLRPWYKQDATGATRAGLQKVSKVNMAKPTGVCAYCGSTGKLQESHILPKWTIRRSLRGSVTGKLRKSENVNHRVQDGEKVALLCRTCENTFSKLEGRASRAFDAGAIGHGAVYDADVVRFLASILWRVGMVRRTDIQAAYPAFTPLLARGLQVWKDVVKGNRTDFDGHPIWFMLLDTELARTVDTYLKATDGRGAPPVINRYFANNFGAEACVFAPQETALIWAKTTSWLILGVVAAPVSPAAAVVEMSLAGGILPAPGHPVPAAVLAGLGYQSWQYLQKASEMRPEQRQRVKDEWARNAGKVAGANQTRALMADVAMFGDDAFVNVPEPEDHGATTNGAGERL